MKRGKKCIPYCVSINILTYLFNEYLISTVAIERNKSFVEQFKCRVSVSTGFQWSFHKHKSLVYGLDKKIN